MVVAHRIDAGRVCAAPQPADWYRLGEALLDAHQCFGESRYRDLAMSLFETLETRALAEVGTPSEGSGVPPMPVMAAMQDHAGIAALALRLAECTGSTKYRNVAARMLSNHEWHDARGPLAATYIDVARRYIRDIKHDA